MHKVSRHILAVFLIFGCIWLNGCHISVARTTTSQSAVPTKTPIAIQTVAPTETPGPSPTLPPTSEPANETFIKEELKANVAYPVDLNGDGSIEKIALNYREADSEQSNSTILSITLQSGKRLSADFKDSYFESAFLFRKGTGKIGIFVCMGEDNDICETYVYVLSGDVLKKTAEAGGFVEKITDTTVRMYDYAEFWLNLTYRDYAMNGNFELVPSGDKKWHLPGGPGWDSSDAHAALVELPAEFKQKDGSYKTGKLSVGEEVMLTATDQETVIDFEMEDGRTGKIAIRYVVEDGMAWCCIGDKVIYECFDNF